MKHSLLVVCGLLAAWQFSALIQKTISERSRIYFTFDANLTF
jgi:hypothetical protein